MSLDRRIHAVRPDLADLALEGRVEAERFVRGEPGFVLESVLPIRREPRPDAGLETEAISGDALTIFEMDAEGWAWVQLARDGYVGYAPASHLMMGARPRPTHKVSVLRTFLFPGATIKEPPIRWLSYGSEVTVLREIEAPNGRRFAVTSSGGAIVAHHLMPIETFEADPVAIAERFLGTPYLWGGKSSLGIDCSGLAQTAYRGCGIDLTRDSDQQEDGQGSDITLDPALWRRGDLLFFPGHVALVRDGDTAIHANAQAMAVAIEPIDALLARTSAGGDPLRRVKRLI
jgi:cell wall-associated NlpC family hydrolase